MTDRIHDVHALGDLAEDRVNLVEMRLGAVADEELAATGILAGVGHGESAGGVLVGIKVGFTLDLVAGPAGPHPSVVGVLGQRIAALNHEVGDHPMEPGAIVKHAVSQLLEVQDRAGNLLVEQLGHNGSLARLNGSGLRHGRFLLSGIAGANLIPTYAAKAARSDSSVACHDEGSPAGGEQLFPVQA